MKRTLEITDVLDVEAGAKTKLSTDSHVQFMSSRKGGIKAVVFSEKLEASPIVTASGEEKDAEPTEFEKKWMIRPGSYWLHSSEGLQENQWSSEVYFETTTSKRITKIFRSFVDNIDVSRKYKRLKRSYLLHSEPGCGKSALIRHFCRQLSNTPGLAIIQVSGDIEFSILTHMFNGKYRDDVKMIVLLIEDMGSRDHSRNMNMYNSSCLNFLDGVAGLFRVPTMIFATTNFAKELGAQFTNRPGRFNRLIKVELPTDEEVFSLVESYTEERLSMAEREALAGKNLNPDHCVEAILRSKIEGMSLPEAVREILAERQGMMKWDNA